MRKRLIYVMAVLVSASSLGFAAEGLDAAKSASGERFLEQGGRGSISGPMVVVDVRGAAGARQDMALTAAGQKKTSVGENEAVPSPAQAASEAKQSDLAKYGKAILAGAGVGAVAGAVVGAKLGAGVAMGGHILIPVVLAAIGAVVGGVIGGVAAAAAS